MIFASKPTAMTDSISIQIVYALPEHAWTQDLTVPVGSTLEFALSQVDAMQFTSAMQVDSERLAIFGQKAKLSDALHEFDRIEILRPLLHDPKDNRRQRAQLNPLKKPKR
jgi:putative ubiquitin-RnfH superfamily antitoxin RatB of RatAB toxin-antitoxin module